MIVSVFSKERQGKQLHQDQEEFTGLYKKRRKRHYTQTQDQDQEQDRTSFPFLTYHQMRAGKTKQSSEVRISTHTGI